MFERFTDEARQVFVDAVSRARDERAADVREEHLLAAVLATRSSAELVCSCGLEQPRAVAVLAEIRTARRRGGLSGRDARALAGLGIDLDAVVGRVEATLGVGALDAVRHRTRRRRSHLRVSAGAKAALERAVRVAAARGDGEIRVAHLLLGLLTPPGLVADVLGGHGVSIAAVLTFLDAHPERGGRRAS